MHVYVTEDGSKHLYGPEGALAGGQLPPYPCTRERESRQREFGSFEVEAEPQIVNR